MGAKPSLASHARDMQYLALTLTAKAGQLEKDAVKARAQAKAAHTQGNVAVTRVHLQSAVGAEKQAATFYASAGRIKALADKVVQMEKSAELVGLLRTLTSSLQQAVPKGVDDLLRELDKSIKKMEEVEGLVDQTLQEQVGVEDEDIEKELAKLDEVGSLELRDNLAELSVTVVASENSGYEERYARLA